MISYSIAPYVFDASIILLYSDSIVKLNYVFGGTVKLLPTTGKGYASNPQIDNVNYPLAHGQDIQSVILKFNFLKLPTFVKETVHVCGNNP